MDRNRIKFFYFLFFYVNLFTEIIPKICWNDSFIGYYRNFNYSNVILYEDVNNLELECRNWYLFIIEFCFKFFF